MVLNSSRSSGVSLPPRPCPHTLAQLSQQRKVNLVFLSRPLESIAAPFLCRLSVQGHRLSSTRWYSCSFYCSLGLLIKAGSNSTRDSIYGLSLFHHRQYKRMSIDTAPSLMTKFSIIHTMHVLKISPKCKLPQVTLLSKRHSRFRLSSCIHCFHSLVYFLPYDVSAGVSLASLPRGQRALCLLLTLLSCTRTPGSDPAAHCRNFFFSFGKTESLISDQRW